MSKLFYDYEIQEAEDSIWDWNLHIVDDVSIGVDVYTTSDTTVFVPISYFKSSTIDTRDVAIALLEMQEAERE